MGRAEARKKIILQRCDANSKKKHKMKVHDGMIAKDQYVRLNGCHRKGIGVK